MGVKKFIHLSALNSNMEHEGYFNPGGSKFLSTKGESEDAVKEHFPDAVIFRPSDIFGQQDRFLFYFCRFFRYNMKWMPLPFAGEGIWKQPVYAADVAQGIVNAVYDHSSLGTTYEAVGPRRYELCEMIDWFNRVMMRDGEWGYKRYDMKWDPLTKIKARINEYNPSVPLNMLVTDKIEREAVTDTTFDLPNLQDLGVTLTKLEDRISWELKHFRTKGYYNPDVGEFEKPAPPKFIEPY
ncbi:UNVERIFIED_CONTAM: hypothetical protein GTU68_053660 [Idotea baltica]|nr:hypothetical protein [Idotea baltica]